MKHWQECHGEKEWSYEMKLVGSHKTPLPRQIMEGHLISTFEGHEILNRKGEWGENLPPKLVVEDQRDGRGATENKGPNLQIPDDAKRKPQNEGGNHQPKRTRMDDNDDQTDPAGASIKVKSRSKIPESLR